MSNQLVKEAQKSGMSITKDRLLDLIKKSNQQSFTISLNPNSKQTVVVIPSVQLGQLSYSVEIREYRCSQVVCWNLMTSRSSISNLGIPFNLVSLFFRFLQIEKTLSGPRSNPRGDLYPSSINKSAMARQVSPSESLSRMIRSDSSVWQAEQEPIINPLVLTTKLKRTRKPSRLPPNGITPP